jgi:hypothetical protein
MLLRLEISRNLDFNKFINILLCNEFVIINNNDKSRDIEFSIF